MRSRTGIRLHRREKRFRHKDILFTSDQTPLQELSYHATLRGHELRLPNVLRSTFFDCACRLRTSSATVMHNLSWQRSVLFARILQHRKICREDLTKACFDHASRSFHQRLAQSLTLGYVRPSGSAAVISVGGPLMPSAMRAQHIRAAERSQEVERCRWPLPRPKHSARDGICL